MPIDTSQITQAKTNNIFSTPIKKAKAATDGLKKKNQHKAWIYLAMATALIIPYSVFFLYPQTQQFLNFQNNLASAQAEIKNYETTLSALKKTESTHKAAYDKEYEAEQEILEMVFPENPDKLSVIKLLENFSTRLSSAYPPFEFTSISFDEPVKKNGYTILPLQTTIHSSRKNFERFLALVDLSGNYNPEEKDHIRLMEISNISLRYRGLDGEGKDQGVDFTIQLNAYSR